LEQILGCFIFQTGWTWTEFDSVWDFIRN